MKQPTFSLLTVGVLALALGSPLAFTPAAAQTAAASAKATAKAPKKGVSKKTIKAVEANTPVQSPSARLTEAEMAIAERVETGTIRCELGANVTVVPDAVNPGFFHVKTGKYRYYMHPVESRTGALRLEDDRASALWLQLANKSMLMDQKLGKRLADECMTSRQANVAEVLKNTPPPSLLDAPASATDSSAPTPTPAAPQPDDPAQAPVDTSNASPTIPSGPANAPADTAVGNAPAPAAVQQPSPAAVPAADAPSNP